MIPKRIKSFTPSLAIYFVILAIVTFAAFIILFPFQLDDYEGHLIGKMGVIGAAFLFLGGVAVLLVNIISTVVFLIRRKHRLISLTILVISGLSLCWPIIAKAIVPYEGIALHRARDLIRSEDFRSLRELYPGRMNSVSVSVLPEPEYVAIGDYVIDFRKKTYGRLKFGLGFFADYYESGDALPFSDLDSLITSLPYHVESRDVIALYKLMRSLHLSDAGVDKKTRSIVFSWEQSALAGTRGIILNGSVDPTLLRSKLEVEEPFERWEVLAAGTYYFRVAAHEPF